MNAAIETLLCTRESSLEVIALSREYLYNAGPCSMDNVKNL